MPILIIVVSLLGATIIGAGIVFLADRHVGRHDTTALPEAKKTPARARAIPLQAMNMKLVGSPGRECLLAWNAARDGGGVCQCLRGAVVLWESTLKNPVFMAVTDDGCAAVLDRDRGSATTVLKIRDVAGIERCTEPLNGDLLEWGASVDGRHLWCVCDHGLAGTGEAGAVFLLAAIDEGTVVVRTADPRRGQRSSRSSIAAVTVEGEAVQLAVGSDEPVRLRFTEKATMPTARLAASP